MNLLAQITSNDTAFIGVASAVVGPMAAAIVHLYWTYKSRIERELDECKSDRDELRKKIMSVDSRVTSIERGKA